MTLKFDDLMRQIDSIDQAHFGETFSMQSEIERPNFEGVIGDTPIFLDGAETLGYELSVPFANWQGPKPRKNRESITRVSTGEVFSIHSVKVRAGDLIIQLVN